MNAILLYANMNIHLAQPLPNNEQDATPSNSAALRKRAENHDARQPPIERLPRLPNAVGMDTTLVSTRSGCERF